MNSEKFLNNNYLLRVLDYFYILRPTLFFPGITIYLFGVHDSSSTFSFFPFLIVLFLLSVTYLTNQIFDIRTDTINDKLFFLTRDIVSLKVAKVYNLFLFISLLASIIYFFSLTNLLFLVIISLLFFIIVVLYNFEFFNWKSKPYLSILSSFLGGLLFYLAGYYSNLIDIELVSFTSVFNSLIFSLPFGIAVVSVSIMTMIADIAGDESCNKKTFAVQFKNKGSNFVIILLSVLNILLSYSILNYVVLFISSISLLLSLLFYFKNYEMKYLSTNVKVSILFLSLAIGYEYPLYLIIIGVYFFVTRMYYKRRFNIVYP